MEQMSDQNVTPTETAVAALVRTMREAYPRASLTGHVPLIPWPELTRNEHTFFVHLAQAALVWVRDNLWALEDSGGSDDDDTGR
jgi:hypothetical protein